MAYIAAGLISVGTGGQNPSTGGTTRAQKIWSYVSNDSLATIAGANYFASAAPMIQKNDIIHVVAAGGGTSAMRSYVVQTSDGVSAITLTKDDTA